MTGEDLKRARLSLGLSRRALAELTELHPDSIRYWERQPRVDLHCYAPDRILTALGLRDLVRWGVYPSKRFTPANLRGFLSSTRARGGVLADKGKSSLKGPRKRCGAQTRKGTPCRAKALPGRTRCKYHGGASTGPRTAEGKARIAEAQRKRWAAWRATQVALGR